MYGRSDTNGSTAGYAALFIAGLAIGTLATAGILMYMAPNSSKRMRRELAKKGIDLRDQAYDRVDDLKENANDLIARGRTKSKKLSKQAKGMRYEVGDTVATWRKAGQRQAKRQAETTRGIAGVGRRLADRMRG